MAHKSKHIIDLTNIFQSNRVNNSMPESRAKKLHQSITFNTKPTQNAGFEVKQKRTYLNAKTKDTINSIARQLKTSMQFVGLTIVLFIMLFGLSNFSAYKEIISYWYRTEVIQAEKMDTPVDKLIKPLEKQDTENIVFNKGKISYINFQIRPADYRIYIPKINKNLPVVETAKTNLLSQNWDALERDIQHDLRKGVVHYPGTAKPGEIGNVFLTAHSSWYPNDPLPYGLSSAFALLDKLLVGDDVYIFNNGQMYIYKVVDKYIVKPDNIEVLNQPSDRRQMTLMTCYPVGTTLSRSIVDLELTYPLFGLPDENNPNNIPNLYTEGKLQA